MGPVSNGSGPTRPDQVCLLEIVLFMSVCSRGTGPAPGCHWITRFHAQDKAISVQAQAPGWCSGYSMQVRISVKKKSTSLYFLHEVFVFRFVTFFCSVSFVVTRF